MANNENTKKEYKYFSITMWKEEQEYLRKMHKNGWKLNKVTGLGMYYFDKCEPEDVVYQLDYNKEKDGEKDEYIQMFKDCGWEYMFDFVGYSYFRKPASHMDGDEEIFCDDDSRLDMMVRVFKGRMVPLIVIFCCLILNAALQTNLHGTFSVVVYGMIVFVLILYVILFAVFGYQFYTYYRSVKNK